MPQVSAGSAHSVIHSIVLLGKQPQMPSLGWVVGWALGAEETQSLAWRGPWSAWGGMRAGNRGKLAASYTWGPGLQPSSHSTSWDPEYDMLLI